MEGVPGATGVVVLYSYLYPLMVLVCSAYCLILHSAISLSLILSLPSLAYHIRVQCLSINKLALKVHFATIVGGIHKLRYD